MDANWGRMWARGDLVLLKPEEVSVVGNRKLNFLTPGICGRAICDLCPRAGIMGGCGCLEGIICGGFRPSDGDISAGGSNAYQRCRAAYKLNCSRGRLITSENGLLTCSRINLQNLVVNGLSHEYIPVWSDCYT